jgi:hypothetical protein
MNPHDDLEQRLFELGRSLTASPSVAANVMAQITNMPLRGRQLSYAPQWRRRVVQLSRIAALAVGICIVWAVIGKLIPQDTSASAFAQQALSALDEVSPTAVTLDERTELIMTDGTRQMSSTWDLLSVGRNTYRRDIYDGDHKRETQWYNPTELGMRQTSIRFDAKTYQTDEHQGGFGEQDPTDRIRFLVQLVDKADRELPPKTIDGQKCRGFEIHANKYGNNPADWIDRIWFDTRTKLPVRIEKERPTTAKPLKALITVQENYKWHALLSADAFIPKIPDGFKQSDK